MSLQPFGTLLGTLLLALPLHRPQLLHRPPLRYLPRPPGRTSAANKTCGLKAGAPREVYNVESFGFTQ